MKTPPTKPAAKTQQQVYFDHNATAPLAEHLPAEIAQWLNYWGNPSSIHLSGRGPKRLLRKARADIARMIGAKPLELVFTAGGSEANNTVLKGVFEKFREKNSQGSFGLMISAVEHPSVTQAAKFLEANYNIRLFVIPVNRHGFIDLEFYKKTLSEETIHLVSVMYANNETGNIFPIAEMSRFARENGALFHTDGVQALGKTTVNVQDWGVDFASFSAHKFYALKGCGVIYSKSGSTYESLIHGGAQERKRRAGTENLLAIASLGSMSLQANHIEPQAERIAQLRDYLEQRILSEISGVSVNGGKAPRLANSLNLTIADADGESLLMNLDLEGFAVSTGAACSSGNPEPSPVLLSMGLSPEQAQTSLRLSLGWSNTKNDVDTFIESLKTIVARLRKIKEQEMNQYV